MEKIEKNDLKITMTIQQKINDFVNTFGKKLPMFCIDFIHQHQLEESQLFSSLNLLYGANDITERQNKTWPIICKCLCLNAC